MVTYISFLFQLPFLMVIYLLDRRRVSWQNLCFLLRFHSTKPRQGPHLTWENPAASGLGNHLHHGGPNDNIMFVRKLNICGTLYACSRIEIHQTCLWSVCTTGRCNTSSIGRLPLSSPIFRQRNKSDFEL